jgi:hypothetical protein
MRVITPLRLAAHTVEKVHLLATVSTYWGIYPVPSTLEHILYYSVAIPLFTFTAFTMITMFCWIGIHLSRLVSVIGSVSEACFQSFSRLPNWLAAQLILARKKTGRWIFSLGRAMMRNGPPLTE